MKQSGREEQAGRTTSLPPEEDEAAVEGEERLPFGPQETILEGDGDQEDSTSKPSGPEKEGAGASNQPQKAEEVTISPNHSFRLENDHAK